MWRAVEIQDDLEPIIIRLGESSADDETLSSEDVNMDGRGTLPMRHSIYHNSLLLVMEHIRAWTDEAFSLKISLLLLLLLGWSRAAAECQAQRSPDASFSVSSSQNQTGHRLIAARMQSDISVKDAVSLSVDQWTEHCGSSGTAFLSVRMSIPQNETSLLPHNIETTTTSTTPAPATPRPDYQLIPGFGYYKRSRDPMTWSEGRRFCESEGAHMVIIRSKREIEEVTKIWSELIWTGVYRENPGSEFVTVTGSRLNESMNALWASGHPNTGAANNCVITNSPGYPNVFNTDCKEKHRIVCFLSS